MRRARTLDWVIGAVAVAALSLPAVPAAAMISGPLASLSTAPVNQSASVTAAATTTPVSRQSGADRYTTSAAISAAAFSPGVPVAYIASGTEFPDALSGGPIAEQGRGPVLLTAPTDVPSSISTELTRLHPAKIIILGGTGSVSSAVQTTLQSYTTGTVTRLAGADRYATSATISAASFSPGVPVAYVASGAVFPDALSGAPAAGIAGGPVLLTAPTDVPSSISTELTRLHPAKIIILGGTGSVSSAVQTTLQSYTTGTVTRLAGADRYATSATISAASFSPGVPVAYVASGAVFPDALSGAPAAGIAGGPVLLTAPTYVPSSISTELTRLHPAKIIILGGTGSVSQNVATILGGGTVGTTCTSPVFVTSNTNGGWSNGGYYVHNNMWNNSYGFGPETLSACSYHSWYVTSSQVNHAGAVLTYPNVHKDYSNVRLSSFKSITSAFAASSPHVGIYDVAYDIWLNGVASSSSTEVMIWTDNYQQVPAGNKVASVTVAGQSYNVWKTSDNKYIAFVPTSVMTSGEVNLLSMFDWLMSKGWLSSTSTLGQICYGVEIVSTGGKPATFNFTNFSITSS